MRDLDKLLLLPEMPGDIPDASLQRLRLQNTLQKRLPSIPGVSVERLFMMSRAEEAAARNYAIGVAYEEDRRRAVVMRAKARAEARLAMAIAEGRV